LKKIKTGIYGLNPLLDGGFNVNSTNVIVGTAGAGKTTFATQFIRRGIDEGVDGIFVSLDENRDQIINEAIEMGWTDIHRSLRDNSLVFIDASGKDFSEFVREDLTRFVDDWKGTNARVVVDPLTPVIWSTKDLYEQRELITFLFRQIRKIGTLLCSLEEHGTQGDLSGREVIIPMYLADTVIHLRHKTFENPEKRMVKIHKCRNSRHSKMAHPYRIMKGFGMVIQCRGTMPDNERGQIDHLKDMLLELKGRIPNPLWKRLSEATNYLKDSDFKAPESMLETEWNISPEELITYVMDDAPKKDDVLKNTPK